jgi:hypothetical protein
MFLGFNRQIMFFIVDLELELNALTSTNPRTEVDSRPECQSWFRGTSLLCDLGVAVHHVEPR